MYAPLALALLAACSSDDVLENNNETTTQGQTLTIRATTGGGTRVSFDKSTYATKWEESDMLYIYAGDTKYVGVYKVDQIIDNHNAYFEGGITVPHEPLTITGYVRNPNVKTSDGGSTTDNKNFGKYIDVDYSEQYGTWEDAMSRCVLFGKSTYDPNNPKKDFILDMKFEYKTTFFKLMLDFGDPSINTTATMCLTGDNMVSNSRINAIGTNAGEQEYAKDLFINIKDVTITNGKATVYVAMYSQPLKNVYLQAVLKNGADGADGDVYDFNISNNATTAITLEPGKVYPIERTGVKQETSSTWEGKGTKDKPYLINSVADLKLLANNVNKKETGTEAENGYNGKFFKLTSDLIINGEWEPIGNYNHAFRGTFDGYDEVNMKNHTISGNITISNLAAKNGAGLFGIAGVNCVIKNLTCKLNLTVTTSASEGYTGTFVGRITDNVTLQNCINLGSITSETINVGGLVGNVNLQNTSKSSNCLIEGCYNKGNVKSTFKNDATTSIGGIVGLVNGGTAKGKTGLPNLKVVGCYTDGSSFASELTSKRYFGGIIGNIANPREAAQTTASACWVSNLTFPAAGGRAYFVASPSSIVFTLDKCWYNRSDKKVSTPVNSTVATTDYKSATELTLGEYISDMNTAWGSDTYMFNTDGTIKTK